MKIKKVAITKQPKQMKESLAMGSLACLLNAGLFGGLSVYAVLDLFFVSDEPASMAARVAFLCFATLALANLSVMVSVDKMGVLVRMMAR